MSLSILYPYDTDTLPHSQQWGVDPTRIHSMLGTYWVFGVWKYPEFVSRHGHVCIRAISNSVQHFQKAAGVSLLPATLTQDELHQEGISLDANTTHAQLHMDTCRAPPQCPTPVHTLSVILPRVGPGQKNGHFQLLPSMGMPCDERPPALLHLTPTVPK